MAFFANASSKICVITVIFLMFSCDPTHAFYSDIAAKIQQKFGKSKPKDNPKSVHDQMVKIYQDRGFKPIWLTENDWTSCATKALGTLKNANQEGLNVLRYEKANKKAKDAENSAQTAYQAEIELTAAMINYIDDVRNGRFNPRKADRQLVMKPDPVKPWKIMSDGFNSRSDCRWFADLTPPYKEYQDLKALLAQYRSLAEHVSWPKLDKKTELEYKDNDPQVITLRQILTFLGDIDSQYNTQDQTFDANVEFALRQFQKRHGLEADGVVGSLTLKALNTPPKDRVRQIIIAMERWRWMPRNPGNRYIQVNIPRFELEAVENKVVKLRSPIIVGMTYRETPVFSVDITAVRFNPSWNIPPGIAVRDKLPKIRRDPSYIRRKGYILYNSSGQRISPDSVDWSSVGSGYFPYRLRQPPGANNALGKIRFTMNNRFTVYLHSTPQQKLFEKPVRTFSSGCIRVRKALELAQFVFNDEVNWSKSVLKQEMTGTKTKNVPLTNTVPVHVTYFTVWLDEKGRPHFVKDVYGQDKQVWDVLKQL